MSLQQEGRRLVQQGIHVLPLAKNSKSPPTGYKWKNGGATNDSTAAFDLFANRDGNYGVRCDNLIVVDFDEYKYGAATPADLGEFPETYTVGTPRGGRHMYFWKPAGRSFANSIGKLAPGVDIKTGPGGYVVGPGSRIGDKAYVVLNPASIAPCPQQLFDRLSATPAKSPKAGKTVGPPKSPNAGKIAGPVDTPEAISRAITYLKQSAPVAVEGQRGDPTTIVVANRVMDFGITPGLAAALMAEHWNNRCVPPWALSHLRYKIGSAFKSRTDTIPSTRRAAGFEAAELVPITDGEVAWPYLIGERVDHAHIGNVARLLEHTRHRLRYNEFAARIEIDSGLGFAPLEDIAVLKLLAFAETKGLRPPERKVL